MLLRNRNRKASRKPNKLMQGRDRNKTLATGYCLDLTTNRSNDMLRYKQMLSTGYYDL